MTLGVIATDSMKYREYVAADAVTLSLALPALLGGHWSAESLAAAAHGGHSLRILETPAGAVAAFAEFQVVFDECQLHSIATLAEYQRGGFGRCLLHAVLEEAVATGLQRCTLEVREGNVAARRLYEGRGFALVGRRKDYYPPLTEGAPREAALLYTLEFA